MTKLKNTEKIIQKWVSEQSNIHFAILFGSFAKGTSNPNSDIDLAIELDHPLTKEIKIDLLQSLAELTDKYIDLIDLKTVGEPLLNQIIQHGKTTERQQTKPDRFKYKKRQHDAGLHTLY